MAGWCRALPLRYSFQKGLAAQLQGMWLAVSLLQGLPCAEPRSWSSCSNHQPMTEQDGSQGHTVS